MRRTPFRIGRPKVNLPNSAGLAAVAAYFVIVYVGPWAGNMLFPEQVISRSVFQILPITTYTVLIVPAVFGLFWFLHTHAFRVTHKERRVTPARVLGPMLGAYEHYRLVIALGSLFLAFLYYREGLNSIRYSPLGISESGSVLVVVVTALNTAISVDLFRIMFIAPPPRSLRRRIETLILACAFLLSANGAIPVFIGLSALLACAMPVIFRGLVFSPPDSPVLVQVKRTLSRGVVVVTLFIAAWLAGEGIKATSSTREENTILGSAQSSAGDLAANGAVEYFFYLIERSSIYYNSLLYTTYDLSDVPAVAGGSPIMLPLKSLLFRADYLLGSPLRIEKPTVPSIMGLNYLLVIDRPNRYSRSGSAPGLIAAFTYALPFPINIVACSLYLLWFARTIDVLLWRRGRQKVSLVGLLLLYMFAEQFLQSPFDLLMVIDGATIFALLTYVLYRVEQPNREAYLRQLRAAPAHVRRGWEAMRRPIGPRFGLGKSRPV